ncbi:carbohydrate ABC transporter permease [Mycoplasmopsis agalactiae]|uniref:carbohydrate ABC transporter permease n=1 Tax=Mycoplasmopsis agalactiae TaxID=2110 RepID=UPI001F22259A|nr:sugar ABC transporter permease [Mycoplasmopsis agalactiae]MCE6115506.1 sugar ABC transporter permease [Mycoplasmopsis agalactiae]
MKKATESMHNSESKKQKVWTVSKITLMLLPLLIFILVFTLVPILHTFVKSLKAPISIHDRTRYNYNFNNYNNILSDPNFKNAVLNSTLVLFFGSGISLVLSLIFALVVNSLISKFTQRAFLTILFSQFFISGFAIGIAFTMFFGNKNLFFYILGKSEYTFTASSNKKLPIWMYYSIFQIWRSLPFNLILFASAISRADLKYKKLMLNDKLTILQKFRYVYMPEISKVLFSILFTNFIFSTLLLPQALLEPTFDIDINYAHTLTSYTIKFLGFGTNNPSLRYEKGYASAFFSFSYLVLLLCILQLLRISTIKAIYRKISKLIVKTRSKKYAR